MKQLLFLLFLTGLCCSGAEDHKDPKWLTAQLNAAISGEKAALEHARALVKLHFDESAWKGVDSALYFRLVKSNSVDLQLVGLAGLFKKADKDYSAGVIDYLRKADLKKLMVAAERDSKQEKYYELRLRAVVVAIEYFTVVKDPKAVAVLEELMRGKDTLLAGTSSIAKALAFQGRLDLLKDKNTRAEVIEKISDPKEANRLFGIAKNRKETKDARIAAIKALCNLPGETSESLLITILQNETNPLLLREVALTYMHFSHRNDGVKRSLQELQLRKDMLNLKNRIKFALLCQDAKEYGKGYFEETCNPLTPLKARCELIRNAFTAPELKECQSELMKCLKAVDKDGRPVDEIRLHAWNALFWRLGVVPDIVLANPDDNRAKDTIESGLNRHFLNKDPKMGFAERQKMVDDYFKSHVTRWNDSKGKE